MKLIDLERFFSVNIMNYDITLIGEYKSETVKSLMDNKFTVTEVASNGWTYMRRGNIRISLS